IENKRSWMTSIELFLSRAFMAFMKVVEQYFGVQCQQQGVNILKISGILQLNTTSPLQSIYSCIAYFTLFFHIFDNRLAHARAGYHCQSQRSREPLVDIE